MYSTVAIMFEIDILVLMMLVFMILGVRSEQVHCSVCVCIPVTTFLLVKSFV